MIWELADTEQALSAMKQNRKPFTKIREDKFKCLLQMPRLRSGLRPKQNISVTSTKILAYESKMLMDWTGRCQPGCVNFLQQVSLLWAS